MKILVVQINTYSCAGLMDLFDRIYEYIKPYQH